MASLFKLDMYLDGTEKLTSFITNDEGYPVQHFIVPLFANAVRRYELRVSHPIELKIGAQLKVDGVMDDCWHKQQGDFVRLQSIGNDILGIKPVVIAEAGDAEGDEQTAKTIGTLQVHCFTYRPTGRMREHRATGSLAGSGGPELRADSQTLSEKTKSKMCSLNTVSAGKLDRNPRSSSTPSVSMVPEYEHGPTTVLYATYASADNYFLRRILPDEYLSLVSTTAVRRERVINNVGDDDNVIDGDDDDDDNEDDKARVGVKRERGMRVRGEKKPRLSGETTTATPDYKIDDDGVLDLT